MHSYVTTKRRRFESVLTVMTTPPFPDHDYVVAEKLPKLENCDSHSSDTESLFDYEQITDNQQTQQRQDIIEYPDICDLDVALNVQVTHSVHYEVTKKF